MNRTTRLFAALLLAGGLAAGQTASGDQPEVSESKRILGIIPDYRTSPTLDNFKPLTAEQKLKVASDDALDRGTFALAGILVRQKNSWVHSGSGSLPSE